MYIYINDHKCMYILLSDGLMMPIQFFFVSPTWPHPAAPAQSQRCPGSLNLLPTNEKQEALPLNLHGYTRIGRGMPFEIEIPGPDRAARLSLRF